MYLCNNKYNTIMRKGMFINKGRKMYIKLIVSIVCVSALSNASAQNVTIDGLKYYLYPETHEAAIDYGNTWSGELILPSEVSYNGDSYTVNGISHGAFRFCKELTRVRIPKTIDRVIHHVLTDDPHVMGSVSSDCMNPFEGCTALESIEVDDENPIMRSIGGILFNKDGTRLYAYPGGMKAESYAVPDGVTWIGFVAFSSNEHLVTVELPASVSMLCGGCFDGCGRLVSVELPEGITHLEAYMFRNCSCLKSIEIPRSVTSLGEQVFYDCSSLKVIDVPSNVTFIGSISFSHCKLDALIIRGTLDSQCVNRYLLSGLDKSSTLYVPATEIDRYKELFTGTVLPLEEYGTGIQLPTATKSDPANSIYDLSGRRVQGAPKKGVYIQGEKKMVISGKQ